MLAGGPPRCHGRPPPTRRRPRRRHATCAQPPPPSDLPAARSPQVGPPRNPLVSVPRRALSPRRRPGACGDGGAACRGRALRRAPLARAWARAARRVRRRPMANRPHVPPKTRAHTRLLAEPTASRMSPPSSAGTPLSEDPEAAAISASPRPMRSLHNLRGPNINTHGWRPQPVSAADRRFQHLAAIHGVATADWTAIMYGVAVCRETAKAHGIAKRHRHPWVHRPPWDRHSPRNRHILAPVRNPYGRHHPWGRRNLWARRSQRCRRNTLGGPWDSATHGNAASHRVTRALRTDTTHGVAASTGIAKRSP